MTKLNEGGNLSIHGAAYAGHVEVIDALVKHNAATVNARGRRGNTALHFAASHGHTAAVNALLAAGADKALANDKGQLPADLSVAYPVCQEALAPSPVELQDLAVGAVGTVGAVGEGPIAAVAMADLYVEAAAAVQASVAEASAEAASSGEEFAAEGEAFAAEAAVDGGRVVGAGETRGGEDAEAAAQPVVAAAAAAAAAAATFSMEGAIGGAAEIHQMTACEAAEIQQMLKGAAEGSEAFDSYGSVPSQEEYDIVMPPQ